VSSQLATDTHTYILNVPVIWSGVCSGVLPPGLHQPVRTLQGPHVPHGLCANDRFEKGTTGVHPIIIHLRTKRMYYITCYYMLVLHALLPRTAGIFKRKFSETKWELTELTSLHILRVKINPNYISRLSSYRAANTLRLRCNKTNNVHIM